MATTMVNIELLGIFLNHDYKSTNYIQAVRHDFRCYDQPLLRPKEILVSFFSSATLLIFILN